MPIGTFARWALAGAGMVLLAAQAAVAADAPPAQTAPPVDARPEARIPGKFVWFDLVTDNPYGAKAFYGVVFGWDFHSVGSGAGRYTMIENRGRTIGGMHHRARRPGSPQGNRWISLMSVADPAQAARYVETHGGTVVVPPTPFEGRGTHALFRDDDGALFGVLTAQRGDAPDGPAVTGGFLWLDLFSRDPKKAAEFYRGLGGYEVSVKEIAPQVSRIALKTGETTRAVILPLPKEIAAPGWLAFVQVDDVAAAVGRATANGGRVLFAPRPEYFGGHVAVIADPQGGVIGIVNHTEALKKGAAK